MVYFIIILLILFVILFLYIKLRKPKKNCLLLYSGSNGSGKSFNMTNDSIRFLKKARNHWKHINKPFWSYIYLWIPYFNNKRKNNESYGLNEPMLYSSYPIRISKKELSIKLTNDIMFLEKTIPLNSIVVIDEFSGWISQFEYNEKFSNTLNEHMQKFRHYHGNLSHLLIADQCTNNIPIQVRYRCNTAIVFRETKHYWFIHISKYKNIELTDDIKSVEIIDNDNSDTDDKILRMISFSLKRKYDDRAYSNRYTYVDDSIKNYKYIDSPLKVDETLKKPNKKHDYVDMDKLIEEKKNINIIDTNNNN